MRRQHKGSKTMKISYFSMKKAKFGTFSQVALGEKPQLKMILDFNISFILDQAEVSRVPCQSNMPL